MLVVKKTHICLYVTLLILSIGCQITDPDSPDPQDTFVKYYGVGGSEVGIDLEYDATGPGTTDGSLIVLSSVVPSDGVERDIVVRRVDLAGNEINSGVYDFRDTDPEATGNGGGDDEPGAILVEDDGFIVVGTTSRDLSGDPYTALFILELNEQLDSVRSKILSQTVNDAGVDEGFDLRGLDVVRASDGTLIVTGSSNFEEAGDPLRGTGVPGDETQILIAKVDLAQDSVYWRRTRGFSGNDEGIYIDEFERDNFVIIGTSDKERASQGRNVLLLPINELASPNDGVANGFTIDSQEDFDDVAAAVFKRPSGYVVTGTSSKAGAPSRPFFVNFTYTSAEAVTMDLGKEIVLNATQVQEGNANGIALGRNGNYVVIGEFINFVEQNVGKNSEVLVTQLDQSGTEVADANRNYGLVAGNDIGEDIIILPGGGDILVLSTVDFGSGNTLLGLMRLNQDGDIAQ